MSKINSWPRVTLFIMLGAIGIIAVAVASIFGWSDGLTRVTVFLIFLSYIIGICIGVWCSIRDREEIDQLIFEMKQADIWQRKLDAEWEKKNAN